AALVDLEIGTTFVVAPIEIVDGRNVGLLRRNTESIQDFPGQPLALDTPSARAAMEFAGAGVMVFDVLEDRQDVLPAPAGVPLRRPAVVVGRLAAHVDHAVDGRTAAQHSPTRIPQPAIID